MLQICVECGAQCLHRAGRLGQEQPCLKAINISHPAGLHLTLDALDPVRNRRLLFEVQAHDGVELIRHKTHHRFGQWLASRSVTRVSTDGQDCVARCGAVATLGVASDRSQLADL